MNYNYYTYMLTNKTRSVLYTGVTNDLYTRLEQHKSDAKGFKRTFAGKYNCYYLVWFEIHQYIDHAIDREKEIKGKSRNKKVAIIDEFNPECRFLNNEV